MLLFLTLSLLADILKELCAFILGGARRFFFYMSGDLNTALSFLLTQFSAVIEVVDTRPYCIDRVEGQTANTLSDLHPINIKRQSAARSAQKLNSSLAPKSENAAVNQDATPYPTMPPVPWVGMRSVEWLTGPAQHSQRERLPSLRR